VKNEMISDVFLALNMADRLPDGYAWEVSVSNYSAGTDVKLTIQAGTQEHVRSVQEALQKALRDQWVCSWCEGCKWWQYDATVGTLSVQIYAVREAPPNPFGDGARANNI